MRGDHHGLAFCFSKVSGDGSWTIVEKFFNAKNEKKICIYIYKNTNILFDVTEIPGKNFS